MIPDLKAIAAGTNTSAYHVTARWLPDDSGKAAIKLESVSGQDRFIPLAGIQFTNGVIEFDAKGKSSPPQSNFIGVAFRIENTTNFDAVYFRPFNFQSPDAARRIRAVQYVSLPEWPWQRLRAEKSGQFEKGIEPAPDGDAWFHAKIVVKKPTVSVFVNGATDPSLVVNELSARDGGGVGLWCNGFGFIANLQITPAP